MAPTPTHDRCPYTLKPLADLPAVDQEHIFPHAVGGSGDYCVQAYKKANSVLGSKVDAPFVNSFLPLLDRVANGIKSRTGHPSLKMQSTNDEDGKGDQATMEADGNITFKPQPTIKKSEDGMKEGMIQK